MLSKSVPGYVYIAQDTNKPRKVVATNRIRYARYRRVLKKTPIPLNNGILNDSSLPDYEKKRVWNDISFAGIILKISSSCQR